MTYELTTAADLTAVQTALGGVLNGFSAAKYRQQKGLSIDIGVWTDSVGAGSSNPRRWPWLLADKFAALDPTALVQVRDGSSTTFTGAAVVVQAGTGGPTITIWNFAVSGTLLMYGLGSNFERMLRTITVDAMIIAHGLNHASGGYLAPVLRGEFIAALERYREYHPETPVVLVRENPFQDNATMDNVVAAVTDVGTRRDCSVVDVHSEFVALGKPPSLYLSADTTHPSQTGQDIYRDKLWAHWLAAAAVPCPPVTSAFSVIRDERQSLLLNGTFKTWTTNPGVPDNWTAGGAGTLTAQKETTTVYRSELGYSASFKATSNQAYIKQRLDSTIRQELWGCPITLAALIYKDPVGNVTQGCIGLAQGSTLLGSYAPTTRGYRTAQDGWVWQVISGFMIGTDATYIDAYLYADTAASPQTNPIFCDQITCVPGYMPARCA